MKVERIHLDDGGFHALHDALRDGEVVTGQDAVVLCDGGDAATITAPGSRLAIERGDASVREWDGRTSKPKDVADDRPYVRQLVQNLEKAALGVMIVGVVGTLFVFPQHSTIGLGLFVGLYLVAFLADEFIGEDDLVAMIDDALAGTEDDSR